LNGRKAFAFGLVGIHLHHKAELFQIVGATRTPRRLAGARQRRQQDSGQNADNGDDNQQLDQCKPTSLYDSNSSISYFDSR
jgi:hypothetical protein